MERKLFVFCALTWIALSGSADSQTNPADANPPNPCSKTKCSDDLSCALTLQICSKPPCSAPPQCVKNPCHSGSCPKKGEYCYPFQVQCVRAPCYPVAHCLDPCQDLKCKPGTSCVIKNYNCDKRDYCPPYAVCEDPCTNHVCPRGEKCQPTLNEKSETVPICLSPCSWVRCAGACRVKFKPNGEAYPECYQPNDPCRDLQCGKNETCVLITQDCGKPPCKSYPKCVDKNPCKGIDCVRRDQSCYPKQVECIRAPCPLLRDCHNPCDGVECEPGSKCVVEKYDCAPENYCPPYGVCKPK